MTGPAAQRGNLSKSDPKRPAQGEPGSARPKKLTPREVYERWLRRPRDWRPLAQVLREAAA